MNNDERDADGNLAVIMDWALARDALTNAGCDCGVDEPETCLACLCESAMKAERAAKDAALARAEKAESERDEVRAQLVEVKNQWMAATLRNTPGQAKARIDALQAQGMNEAVRIQSERDDLNASLDFPMRDTVFAATIHGGTEEDGPWLVTLVCGHKVAVRKRRVSYPCGECRWKAGGGE